MAGHSKWKNIQHRKGAQDTKRAKIFTKIAREIIVAARIAGGNPDDNPRLRAALSKAKIANMPKDNWTKAIKKGLGDTDGVQFVEKTYEGYGPGGIAVFVECLTDNPTRTVNEVRHAFSRSGGNLGTDGSVAWMFARKGLILYESSKITDFEKLFELAIDAGAEDVQENDGAYEITCPPNELMNVKAALDTLCDAPDFCESTMLPENKSDIEKDKVQSLEKLIDTLEDNDDVQQIYHNANFPN